MLNAVAVSLKTAASKAFQKVGVDVRHLFRLAPWHVEKPEQMTAKIESWMQNDSAQQGEPLTIEADGYPMYGPVSPRKRCARERQIQGFDRLELPLDAAETDRLHACFASEGLMANGELRQRRAHSENRDADVCSGNSAFQGLRIARRPRDSSRPR